MRVRISFPVIVGVRVTQAPRSRDMLHSIPQLASSGLHDRADSPRATQEHWIMMRTSGPLDDFAFRTALNAHCALVSSLSDVNPSPGTPLIKWSGRRFSMRVQPRGGNGFATIARGHISTVEGVTTVRYRTTGWNAVWGWFVVAGFFWGAWSCEWRSPVTNRAVCLIPMSCGVVLALVVGLGRYTTRQDGVRMIELIETAIRASLRAG